MAPADERYAKRRQNGIANSFHSMSRGGGAAAWVRVMGAHAALRCGLVAVFVAAQGDALKAVT
ncbi:hypothetical protein B0G82_6294 [Paraburkholderia sp. BL17N1]|nr:hypothetical protein B0G82_6294 [Paraburkholderia sp. BL17N1]